MTKPKEREFPADLEQLGLFVHPECDQIRPINTPDEPFEYHFYGKGTSMDTHRLNERMNRARGVAVNECMADIALSRLINLGMKTVGLPPDAEKQVPILVTPDLHLATSILIVAPDSSNSGLGVHSFRHAVSAEGNLRTGSMQELALQARKNGYDGLVFTNPASLCWDPVRKQAINYQAFQCRPSLSARQTAASAILDSDQFVIPGHELPESHLESVLKWFHQHLSPNAKVDFIATGYSAYALLVSLSRDYSSMWFDHLNAGVLADSSHSMEDFADPRFQGFLRKRCRNYICHADPVGKLQDPNVVTCVATFSSGQIWAEQIVPGALEPILAYLKKARSFPWGKSAGVKPTPSENVDEPNEAVQNEWDEDSEELNPVIPVMMSGTLGNAHQDWMEALKRLHLGDEKGGWDVPGSEQVYELKERAEKEGVIVDHWKDNVRAEVEEVQDNVNSR